MPAAWYGPCTDCLHTEWGMGEQFQLRHWNPHWVRVAEEDEAMKIGPWVATEEEEGILGSPGDSRSRLQTVTPA